MTSTGTAWEDCDCGWFSKLFRGGFMRPGTNEG